MIPEQRARSSHYTADIVAICRRRAGSGSRVLDNRTQLIGHRRNRQPGTLLYTYAIFPGLDESAILDTETRIRRRLPESYRNYLIWMNGCILYAGAFSIYGVRSNMDRTPGDHAWQPVDLYWANVSYWTGHSSLLRIGGYTAGDGVRIGVGENGVVTAYPRDDGSSRSDDSYDPIATWDSFEAMFTSEVSRLDMLYDDDPWDERLFPSN